MSSFGDAIGGIGGLFGDEGENKLSTIVKNKELQSRIDTGITDYDTIKSSGESALAKYISNYLAGEGASKTRTGQEIGAIDRYFSGATESDLLQMRLARAKAVRDAAARAGRYAIANVSRSRIGREGGPSSYDSRLLMRNMTDIDTQAALDDALASRADYDYLERARLGIIGQRNRLADAQAGYGLVPENVRRQMYQQNLGYLGYLGELDRGNKFYGIEYDPSTSERIGGVVSDIGSGIMEGASAFGSVMGGMGGIGGGAPAGGGGGTLTPAQRYSFNMGAGPVSAPYASNFASPVNTFSYSPYDLDWQNSPYNFGYTSPWGYN